MHAAEGGTQTHRVIVVGGWKQGGRGEGGRGGRGHEEQWCKMDCVQRNMEGWSVRGVDVRGLQEMYEPEAESHGFSSSRRFV